LDVWRFGLKTSLNLLSGVALVFLKMIPPGTMTVVLVPEVGELTRVSFAPMRAAGIVNLTQEERTVGTQARNHVSSSRQLTIASTQIASSHKPNLDFITVR
jgi:hypothetical protein